MAKQPKERPSNNDALILIHVRRKRAEDVLRSIIQGFAKPLDQVECITVTQILDYLTNMIQCLELSLKLLSGNWENHNISSMYEIIFSRPHANPTLMQSLKSAIMSQKYILGPAAGLIDHIPDMEALHDELTKVLSKNFPGYEYDIMQNLPDNFARFLHDNTVKFLPYSPKFNANGMTREQVDAVLLAQYASLDAIIDQARETIDVMTKDGGKLMMFEGGGGAS